VAIVAWPPCSPDQPV